MISSVSLPSRSSVVWVFFRAGLERGRVALLVERLLLEVLGFLVAPVSFFFVERRFATGLTCNRFIKCSGQAIWNRFEPQKLNVAQNGAFPETRL